MTDETSDACVPPALVSPPGPRPGHLDEDDLADLVSGILALPRRAKVMGHLRSCSLCASRMRHVVAGREATRARHRLRRGDHGELVVEAQIETPRRHPSPLAWIRAQLSRPATVPSRRPRLRPVPALVTLVVCILAAVGLRSVLGPQVVPDMTESLPWLDDASARGELSLLPGELPTFRGEFTESLDQVRRGVGMYGRGDWAAAVRELQADQRPGHPDIEPPDPSASSSSPIDDVALLRRVYAANALLRLNQPREAIELLRRLRLGSDVPEPWPAYARQTLFHAYRRAGLSAQADSLRSAMLTQAGLTRLMGQRLPEGEKAIDP